VAYCFWVHPVYCGAWRDLCVLVAGPVGRRHCVVAGTTGARRRTATTIRRSTAAAVSCASAICGDPTAAVARGSSPDGGVGNRIKRDRHTSRRADRRIPSFCIRFNATFGFIPSSVWGNLTDGRVTMTTESSMNVCAQPLTNQTLNPILNIDPTTKRHAGVSIQPNIVARPAYPEKFMLLHRFY